MTSTKRLMFEMEQFTKLTGIGIQFHDKGGESKTFHWSDPENKENHYFMDSITSDYFTIAQAEDALRLVNAVITKMQSVKNG